MNTSVEPLEVGITSVSPDSPPTELLDPDTIDMSPPSQQEPPEEQIISEISKISAKIVDVVCRLGFECNEEYFDNIQKNLVQCVPQYCTSVLLPPSIKSLTNLWSKNYSALSFLMNGQLFAEYESYLYAWYYVLFKESVAENCGMD